MSDVFSRWLLLGFPQPILRGMFVFGVFFFLVKNKEPVLISLKNFFFFFFTIFEPHNTHNINRKLTAGL